MGPRIMVAGIGTDVGKTVVSAILTMLLRGDYWKPIQCGDENNSDPSTIEQWLPMDKHTIHPSAYTFSARLSPHHAARLENSTIDIEKVVIPQTSRTLIIEGVGGVMVPLNVKTVSLDLFASWDCQWILVSKHYLGSINHTLLSIETLKQRKIPILGLILNGESNPDSESAITEISQLPVLGRLFPEKHLNIKTFEGYVKLWQTQFKPLLS